MAIAQHGARAVRRAVIDQPDLMRKILLREQRIEGRVERHGLVARRDENGDAL